MSCNCKKTNCGCKDTGLVTPAPCTTDTFECPSPNPCSETFSDCCIIHTGDTIVDLPFPQGISQCEILQILTIAQTQGIPCLSGCGSPLNFKSTSITPTTVSLSWNAVIGATEYIVEFSTDNSTWTNQGIYSPTNLTIIGLTPNTSYYFRVRTTCDTLCTAVTLLIKTKTL
jgi:hypothetical protein